MVRSPERLASDKQKLDALVRANPKLVSITDATGRPPHRYVLELRCRGISHVSAGQPFYRDTHAVEILLGPDYPFSEPTVNFTTPIFHPHIWSHNKVCLGDWRTSEFLDLLVVRLFKVIQYFPDYLNDESVANGQAQAWLEENDDLTPLGSVVPGDDAAPAPRPRFIYTPS